MKSFWQITFALLLILLVPSPIIAKNISPSPDNDRGPLSKVTFIHYRRGYVPPQLPTDVLAFAKPNGVSSNSACYGFIASGARWKQTENFVINPTNNEDISPSYVSAAFVGSTDLWDNQVDFNLFGSSSNNSTATFDFNVTDNQNVVKFGDYRDPNVIAVTNVWGYFYGNPKTRELIEWDMLLNDSFNWGVWELDPTKMDLANIATHELGHAAGMADIYSGTCSPVTMYGYASEGEINKRTLENPDITGVRKLYQ